MLCGAAAGVWEKESVLWWLLSVLVIKAGNIWREKKKEESVKIIKSTPDLDKAFPEYHQQWPHPSWAGIFPGYHTWSFSYRQMYMGLGSDALQWCCPAMESSLVSPKEVPVPVLSTLRAAKRKYRPLRHWWQLHVVELVFDPFLLCKTAQWVVN